MAGSLDNAGLLQLLERGETVLLPNRRAMHSLRDAFDSAQRAKGHRAWEPPLLYDFSAWIGSLWSRLLLEGTDDRILLNPLQEERTWAEIIASSVAGQALTGGAALELARLSASAFALCEAHHLQERVGRAADSHDSRAFAAWLASFLSQCQEDRLLSRSSLESAVADHIRAGRAGLSGSLHFAGFESLTPAAARLRQALSDAGVPLFEYPVAAPSSGAKPCNLIACSDPSEEARWALRWAGDFLRGSGQPRTVALIIPDPSRERAELEPMLREVLAPELEDVSADLSSTPWQFSMGIALGKVPLLRDALILLRWFNQKLPLEQVSDLLLSPYFTHRSALEERVRFDSRELRQRRTMRPEWTLSAVLELTQRSGSGGAPIEGFGAARSVAGDPQELLGQGSHADWAELVRRILKAAGWPGERPLSPAEFQATEAWDGLLDLLSTLDFNRRRLSFRAFLGLLEQGANKQPTGTATSVAPITLLRLEEAEACSFDAVIVLRSTDGGLPSARHAHPLLGRGLQRASKLPGTDAALTYAEVHDRLERLRNRSGRVLFTWAEADEGGELRPSPLALGLGAEPALAGALLAPAEPEAALKLYKVKDPEPRLPLAARSVAGGARVLELQAACGFRAFASLRLGATAPQTQSLGMDPRDRGGVLHKALELFWAEVRTQAALRSLTTEECRLKLRHCVGEAFQRSRRGVAMDDEWALSFLALSEERLVSLLHRWLQFELKRGRFTVLPPEQEQRVEIGPLELTVRPDRIDQVEGGFVFVDYKTSFDLHTRQWLGERPDAPQLPLYSLLHEPQAVRGLAFAQLRPGKDMGWIGLQKEQGDLEADRATPLHDLELQVSAWREELSRLAHAFADGVTDVDPKRFPHTCRFCDQRLLCRLNRSAWLAQDEDTEEVTEQDG